MELRWLSFKFNSDLHVHVNRAIDNSTSHTFHGILKPSVEEPTEKRFEDLEEDFPSWLWYAEEVKVTREARCEGTATAARWGGTHAENRVLNVLPESLFSVVQPALINEETE